MVLKYFTLSIEETKRIESKFIKNSFGLMNFKTSLNCTPLILSNTNTKQQAGPADGGTFSLRH
jgi:hypothetical protein